MKAFVLNGDERSQKLTLQANIPFVELYKKARFSYMTDPATNPYEGDVDLPRNEFYQRRSNEEAARRAEARGPRQAAHPR